ncbi:hypothetical protein VTO42DRAFT_4763 [Malbranchea cinnamomea]
MPGTVAETPSVSLSFANNFWGKDDAGVAPLLERMHNAKVTCDELKYFYSTRAAIEDEYARKLLALCRKPLGSCEMGTLRASLDTVRGETEAIGKTHSAIASQMKSELEEPLAAFAGGMKERRKIVQHGIEKLLKQKIQQTHAVNKSRDRYEQDCLRIKGYLAQGHMVMGQEERKNKAKLEKTQIQLASNSSEYEAAIKVLEETTGRWNKEWKAACDKFQDLEEERLDFTKSSLWNYANIASTACVSDDASFEKIRVSLESCEVEKDISIFIKERGTGQEIPDPPKFINFCRGDIHDTNSETSEEDNFSVAQFHRTINPAYRSSSPQPSTYESHHDPNSELAKRMSKNDPGTPSSREATVTPQKPAPAPQVSNATADSRRSRQAPSHYHKTRHGDNASTPRNGDGTLPQASSVSESRRGGHMSPNTNPGQHEQIPTISSSEYSAGAAPRTNGTPDGRRGQQLPPNYDPNQHGEIPTIPHNEYPTDGMTMFCRTGPPSEKSSITSAHRPSSRDSRSEVSNPTSFSSAEPPSGQQSPTKPSNQMQPVAGVNENKQQQPQKKKSTFFSNSPFRRKSKHEKERPQPATVMTNRNTWAAPKQTSPVKPSPFQPRSSFTQDRQTGSPEPADPRASFQLNVGNNVFDVASPDKTVKGSLAKDTGDKCEEVDPIAQALADLKGAGKQASVRVSADRYHGIATPVPPPAPSEGSAASAQRGTPPPAYNDTSVKRLDAPQPAFTAAQMQKTTRKYVGQTQEMFNDSSRASQRPSTATTQATQRPSTATSQTASQPSTATQSIARAASPAPAPRRSLSPRPSSSSEHRPSYTPSTSKNGSMNSRYRQSPSVTPANPVREPSYSPQYSRHNSPSEIPPAASPRPQFRQPERPGSSNGMELQLSTSQVDPYYAYHPGSIYGGSQRGYGHYDERPLSMYYWPQDTGAGGQVYRARSRSVAAADGRQYSRDGRPILHYARAMYSYTAAIPEELGFTKGDILAVLRHQDDGWWEAEIVGQPTPPGLVPSNYLSQC